MMIVIEIMVILLSLLSLCLINLTPVCCGHPDLITQCRERRVTATFSGLLALFPLRLPGKIVAFTSGPGLYWENGDSSLVASSWFAPISAIKIKSAFKWLLKGLFVCRALLRTIWTRNIVFLRASGHGKTEVFESSTHLLEFPWQSFSF